MKGIDLKFLKESRKQEKRERGLERLPWFLRAGALLLKLPHFAFALGFLCLFLAPAYIAASPASRIEQNSFLIHGQIFTVLAVSSFVLLCRAFGISQRGFWDFVYSRPKKSFLGKAFPLVVVAIGLYFFISLALLLVLAVIVILRFLGLQELVFFF